MTLKATYAISGITNKAELASLNGAIVAWMISHPNTVLAVYQDEVEE
jgi:hypothetical protein